MAFGDQSNRLIIQIITFNASTPSRLVWLKVQQPDSVHWVLTVAGVLVVAGSVVAATATSSTAVIFAPPLDQPPGQCPSSPPIVTPLSNEGFIKVMVYA